MNEVMTNLIQYYTDLVEKAEENDPDNEDVLSARFLLNTRSLNIRMRLRYLESIEDDLKRIAGGLK